MPLIVEELETVLKGLKIARATGRYARRVRLEASSEHRLDAEEVMTLVNEIQSLRVTRWLRLRCQESGTNGVRRGNRLLATVQ